MSPLADDDPRRQALVELRARQLLIFAVDDVDDGTDISLLAEALAAAFQELGPTPTSSSAGASSTSFTLTSAPPARPSLSTGCAPDRRVCDTSSRRSSETWSAARACPGAGHPGEPADVDHELACGAAAALLLHGRLTGSHDDEHAGMTDRAHRVRLSGPASSPRPRSCPR